jgi:hypothetical protein
MKYLSFTLPLLVLSSIAYAQPCPHKGDGPPPSAAERIERVADTLRWNVEVKETAIKLAQDLDQSTAQLRNNIETYVSDIKQARSDGLDDQIPSLREALRPLKKEMRTYSTALHEDIRLLLTPEEQELFDEKRDEKAKHHQRHRRSKKRRTGSSDDTKSGI